MSTAPKKTLPSVELILKLDREYREKATAGQLKKIAPRKFNPEGKAWLPVMSLNRSGWMFTLLYSNTERAHRLGKTNDWVVAYYDDGTGQMSNTVVTEHGGKLAGRRVVRGRESECADHYSVSESHPPRTDEDSD